MTDPVLTLDYLGHAGFLLRVGHFRILIDPWFFPAFLESWFPSPDNRFLLDSVWDEPVDFLYVSHAHEDHLDRRTLEGVSKDAVVLCPDFRSKSVKRALGELGFRDLVLLGHGQSLELASDLVATALLDTSHKEDSALLIDAGGLRFLDLNDCHLRLNEMPRGVDLLAAQFSGAMWYPNRYHYTPTEMADRVGQVRANLIDTLARTCEACDAQAYLPSAGPPCFLDPALEAYNNRTTTIFHGWDDISEEFLDRCHDIEIVTANPGDRISARATGRYFVERSVHVEDSLASYRERRRHEWDIHAGASVPVTVDQLTAYLSSLGRKNRHLLTGHSKRIRISTADESWDITLGPDDALSLASSTPAFRAEYAFEMPPWVLRRIVDRQTTWEDALLSMRISLARDPDRFDARLLGLLRYGQQPIQTKQMLADSLRSEELIQQGGVLCQRYCPHAGEDLTFAKVSGRTLECPRHHWKWDLDTGMCLDGGDLPLVVRPGSLGGAQPA